MAISPSNRLQVWASRPTSDSKYFTRSAAWRCASRSLLQFHRFFQYFPGSLDWFRIAPGMIAGPFVQVIVIELKNGIRDVVGDVELGDLDRVFLDERLGFGSDLRVLLQQGLEQGRGSGAVELLKHGWLGLSRFAGSIGLILSDVMRRHKLDKRHNGEDRITLSLTVQLGDTEIDETKLTSLCRQYCVMELSLFGSAARGEMRAGSDIDILVEFLPDAEIDLVDYAGLMLELERLLGRKVDLVSKSGLKPLIRASVLKEARLLYAA